MTFPRILRRHSCSRRSTLCKNAKMPTNVHIQPRTQRCHARCPAEACRVCCHAGRWECAKSRCMSTGAYHAVRWSLHTQGNSGDALSFPRQDSLKNQGSKKKTLIQPTCDISRKLTPGQNWIAVVWGDLRCISPGLNRPLLRNGWCGGADGVIYNAGAIRDARRLCPLQGDG